MKRLVMLLLVAAVSLSLCACGQTDPRIEKYENYHLIIECLENGDYDKAIDIIEGWAGEHSEDSATISSVATEPTKPALTPEQLAWQADAVGTWIPNKTASEDGHTGFTINPDGTCTLDGKNYTWQIGNSTETGTQITVLEGDAEAYMLRLSVNSDYGYKKASLAPFADGHASNILAGSYYRNEDYTVVEITSDNWQDYFEIDEVLAAGKNAFGEFENLRSQRCFRLKDAESIVNAGLSSGAVEYKYVSTCLDVAVDFENMTYTAGAARNATDCNDTEKLGYVTAPDNTQYYGVSIGGFVASGLDKHKLSTVWRPMGIEIVRVQATLYIVKK